MEKKIEILNRLEKGETGASLAKFYNVGKATISDIKNKKDTIISFASKLDSEDGSKKRKTMTKPKDEKLDEAMFLWFVQRRSKGEPISGPLLCEKALQINEKLGGPPDFKASSGCLKNFKSRHGIRELEIQGESLSSDVLAAEKLKKNFSEFIKNEGFTLDDVYNTDETGLVWKALPSKSLSSKREAKAPGFKTSKARVTILVTANASGNHALPLLMIGKAKKPRCFKNVACLPLTYKAQKNSWMESGLFFEWYKNDIIPNVKAYRKKEKKTGKVLLILDNAPCHPEAEELNKVDKNFSVMYLPPNVTALLQPMDQGVIEKMKRVYRKQVLRRLLLAESNEESVADFAKSLNLKDCCYMAADAWSKLTVDNLKNAWNKLLKQKDEKTLECEDHETAENPDDDLEEIVEMLPTIPGFSECDRQDAETWLQNYDDDPGYQIMNDEEILQYVTESEDIQNKDEDDDNEGDNIPDSGPSHEEAYSALNTAMTWYERQEESCPTQLLLLKQMRDLAAKKRQSKAVQRKISDYFSA